MLNQEANDLVFATQAMETSDVPDQNRRQLPRLRFGGPLQVRRVGEKEALFLALICAVDMYTTLWWVTHGIALEANPLLAWTFLKHPVLFVVVKSFSCLPPLLFLTAMAQKRPAFTVLMLRVAIVAYIIIYLMNVR